LKEKIFNRVLRISETILNFCRMKLVITLSIILLHSTAFPQGLDNIDPIGTFKPDGWFAEMLDVELVGQIAWVAGVGGLSAFDISNPEDPNLPFSGRRFNPSINPYGERFYHSAIGENFAYASGRFDGISIINKTNINLLKRESVHKEEGVSYEGLYLEANQLYAARHEKGLEIFDIVGNAIVSKGVYENLTNAWTVIVEAGIAYVADGSGGLKILDVTDPNSISELSSIAATGSARDVDLVDGIAYVAVGSQGLDIFDVNDPLNPIFLSNYQSPFFTAGVSVDDQKAYLAEWDIVEVIDVSKGKAPFLLGWEEMTMRGMGIAARDNLLYVANWANFNILRFGKTVEPDIYLPETFHDFGSALVGNNTDLIIRVHNTGSTELSIMEIFSTGEVYTIDTGFLNIAAGEVAEIKLTFTPLDDQFTQAVVFFKSNDPDESSRTFTIRGGTSSLQIGDSAPDFTLNDVDGIPHTLSDYAGNVIVLSFFASW